MAKKLTPEEVEDLFTWVTPEDPHSRLISKISSDFAELARSILYNVPDTPERTLVLKRLHEAGAECARLIRS